MPLSKLTNVMITVLNVGDALEKSSGDFEEGKTAPVPAPVSKFNKNQLFYLALSLLVNYCLN